MKSFIYILLLLSFNLYANVYKLKVVNVTSNIDCYIGDLNPPTKENKGFVSNVCTVDIGDSIVVIDAGPTYVFAKELNELIKKKYAKDVSYVIVTNFHDDRYTGASFYKEKNIPIIAHKTIVQELKENPDKFNRIPKITSKEEYSKSKVVEADIFTNDKYVIKGKKFNIEVLKLSQGANSVSDIAVYIPKEEFIFTGNIVFNGRMIKYAKYSNINEWIKALEKLEKMNVKYVMGGHGKEFDKTSYKPTLEYLRVLKQSVTKAYDDEVDVEDIYNYVDDKKFSYYDHYKTIAPLNAKTLYDQLEWE
ncbi:MBL fold metallo-hydrolase [Poseidonibacter ostreae]|jgi:cyclase|uniref:MBL fold metallo-hydrolase n=1 Tax=Poseidonibacter ostreae TaxID=2654171 RepID=A0A6L4WT44_9BACT|nr:MBL fold metallo-hydrolase [Poseidonibacter ostreae]KAB7885900.1 MBL fold metallo-hydrolase [Poseidonibacter ostreae]KAB7889377.1 MBL fold metallo-hydrolase [Poseidonibacter ostreae]KAB7891653.1 MBL fold metallo-hydrolase [Poseidonibacter ostreae]